MFSCLLPPSRASLPATTSDDIDSQWQTALVFLLFFLSFIYWSSYIFIYWECKFFFFLYRRDTGQRQQKSNIKMKNTEMPVPIRLSISWFLYFLPCFSSSHDLRQWQFIVTIAPVVIVLFLSFPLWWLQWMRSFPGPCFTPPASLPTTT